MGTGHCLANVTFDADSIRTLLIKPIDTFATIFVAAPVGDNFHAAVTA